MCRLADQGARLLLPVLPVGGDEAAQGVDERGLGLSPSPRSLLILRGGTVRRCPRRRKRRGLISEGRWTGRRHDAGLGAAASGAEAGGTELEGRAGGRQATGPGDRWRDDRARYHEGTGEGLKSALQVMRCEGPRGPPRRGPYPGREPFDAIRLPDCGTEVGSVVAHSPAVDAGCSPRRPSC